MANGKISQTPYVGNSYVSFDDSLYTNQLKVDFAWSIEGKVDTTGINAFIKSYTS